MRPTAQKGEDAVKRILLMLIAVMAIVVSGCSGGQEPMPTQTPWVVTVTPEALDPTATAMQEPVVEPSNTLASVATATPTPEPTTAYFAAGQVASDQPSQASGYHASPIGSLSSSLPILCEVWGGNQGYVITIPVGMVAWLQRHTGGTCWWVDSTDLDNAVQRSVDAISDRDGVVPTVVRLPVDTFPLLGCLQSLPVNDGSRICDTVGGLPAYNAPANMPEPGYFPGYGQ